MLHYDLMSHKNLAKQLVTCNLIKADYTTHFFCLAVSYEHIE